MTGKKKLIIAISAMVLVVIAAIISVVAVLAAQQVTLNSSISVNYAVTDIYGKAKVSYKTSIGEGGTYTTWKTNDNKDEATFAGGASETWALATTPFTLNKTTPAVTIKFEFQKDSGAEDFKAQLSATLTKTKGDIIVKYGETETPTTALTATTATVLTPNNNTVSNAGSYGSAFYVTIQLANTKADVQATLALAWTLSN